MMEKNKLRGVLAELIVIVVFSSIAFLVPFEKNGGFWLGYAFGILAIVAQVYYIGVFSGQITPKSKFYGVPLVRVGIYYLVIQLSISLIEFIAGTFIPVWLAAVVNIIVLAAAMLGSIATNVMRDEIVRQDIELEENLSNMRYLQSVSTTLVDNCKDVELKNTIKKLADAFKYSDPVSSAETYGMEIEMKSMLQDLQNAILSAQKDVAVSLCEKTIITLNERNRICKLTK